METYVTYKLPEVAKQPLFLPPPYCRKAQRRNEKDYEELPPLKLLASNPSKLLSLYETLTDNSSKALEVKINKYLMKEGACKLSFLIHLLPATEEAVVQVVGEEEEETSLRVSLPEEMMKQLVLFQNETLKCDEYINTQILLLFNKIFVNLRCSITLVPILRKEKYYMCAAQNIQPALLVCFVESQKQEDFLIRTATELFRYCLPVLLNIMSAEEETRQKRQYKSLLTVIGKLFLHLDNINELLKVITEEARKLTYAQNGSLFLTDPEHIDFIRKAFNITPENKYNAKIKTTKDNAIPDYVVSSRKPLNIENAIEHPSISENLGFDARNILCFPIRNESDVIGAVQVCNKRGGNFDHFDEEITNMLGLYCGLSISHSLKYTQLENYKIRNELSNELLIYQMREDEENINKKLTCPLIHIYHGFTEFTFDPREVVDVETVCFVVKMCQELGFFDTFSINKGVFIRFVMHVKKGCRDVPYHNWMHLFCTAHFAYLCLKNLELLEKGYITHLEALAYFISCLCHDVDYRGTNNPFQEKCNSAVASLYSSPGSVMERHRLSQVLRILSSEGCNFLESLDPENYSLFMNLMKDLILSTDLSAHVKFYRKQYNMIHGGYDRNNPEHRYIFVSLLMTCADLSDHTKDWLVSKKVAQQIYEEFFTRGDLDSKISNQPIKMIDIKDCFIPELQINLLKEVCLPVFKLLAATFTETKELIRNIKRNMLYWEASKHVFKKALVEERPCSEVLASKDFDKELEVTIELLQIKK